MERKFGDYRTLESVGGDQFGDSYLVAGKVGNDVLWLTLTPEVFDKAEQARMLEELRSCMNVAHDNLLLLKDAGFSSDGRLFLVQEFFNATSLQTILEKNDPLFWVPVMGICHEICSALAMSHEKGVAHGRLEASSVLINENGHVKIRGMGVQAIQDVARGEISLAGSQHEGDMRAVGSMVRSMLCGEQGLPNGLPSIVERICEWADVPVTAQKGVESSLEALRMGGVQNPREGLSSFFKEWSFFFLLNRMFSEDSKGGIGVTNHSQDTIDAPLAFDENLVEPAPPSDTPGGDWADDLGGVFLDVEEIPESEETTGSRKTFSALDSLEASDREEERRKKAWMKNLLIGASVLLFGVIAFAVFSIVTGPSPEEMARIEMMEEFPRFEEDFSQLEIEVVRTPAQPETDPEVGGTVVLSWKAIANDLIKEGNLDEARESLRKAASNDVGDWRRHVALANSLLPDLPNEAAQVLDDFVTRVPKAKIPKLIQALVLSDYLGKHREALKVLTDFHPKYQSDPAFLELLYRTQGRMANSEGQVVTLKERIRLPGGDTVDNQLRLAFAHAAANDQLRAQKGFYQLMEDGKDGVRGVAFWGYISASRAMKEVKPMVEVTRGLLNRYSESKELLWLMSEYSLSRRKYKEADGYLSRLEKNHTSWMTQMLRGVLAFRQGQYEQARGHFLQLREVRPKDGRIAFNLGMTLREMELDRLSFAAFAEAAKQDESLWEPLCAMGQDYLSIEDAVSAREMFEKAVERAPEHPWMVEILKIDLKSAKAESLAARPCMSVGLFEDTAYVRSNAPPQAQPIPFKNAEMSLFSPDFRTLESLNISESR